MHSGLNLNGELYGDPICGLSQWFPYSVPCRICLRTSGILHCLKLSIAQKEQLRRAVNEAIATVFWRDGSGPHQASLGKEAMNGRAIGQIQPPVESGERFGRQSKVRELLYTFLIRVIWTGRKVVKNTDNDIQTMKRWT